MTNRRLKKKIRQAFQNATPDLAESIAVHSLFSDVVPKKGVKKDVKTIKTPIQFRALATLAASIAVVALLATIVSMLNPFAPSNTPDEPLTTAPSMDYSDSTINGDPGYSFQELEELKEYMFANADIPFDIEDTMIHAEKNSWGGTNYHTITLTETVSSGDQFRQLSFFLEKGKNTTLYPFDPDADVSGYIDRYLDMSDKNDTLIHQTVLADSRVCYALFADYGATGKFVLIDAETENVIEEKILSGSSIALNQLAQDYDFVAVSYRDYDLELIFREDIPCYQILYRQPVSLYALYDAASHRFITRSDYLVIIDPTVDATEDPLETESPVDPEPTLSYLGQLEMFQIVRDYLGIKQLSQIDDYYFRDHLDSALPYYEIVITMDDYKYVFQVEATYGNILKLDRTYAKDLKGEDLYKVVINESEALQIATQDPLIKMNTGVDSSTFRTEGDVSFYSVYLTDNIYWYRLDVSSSLGIVLNAQVANRNFYLDIDDEYYIETIYPTIGDEDFGGGFDSSPSPINEMDALTIALNNAGIVRTDLIQLELSLQPAASIPIYEIVFLTDNFEYQYDIAVRNGVIISAEKECICDLDDGNLSVNRVSHSEAAQLAKAEPMVHEGFILAESTSNDYTDGTYRFQFQDEAMNYQCSVSVSSVYGIVTEVEISRRGISSFVEDSISVGNISPRPAAPNGMLGAYQALDLALEHLGYTAGNVGKAECSVNGQGFADSYHVYLTTGYINWEVVIDKFTGAIQMVTSSDSGVTPPDGKISEDDAIDAAMRYAGLNVNAAGYLECSEGNDPTFASYYDVAFYFGGYKWHYYIGMYNHQLLHIEKIPLDE